jgi:hypothetical protein
VRLVWACALMLTATGVSAEVYRCERDGRTHYQDRPCHKGDKPAALPDLNYVGTPKAGPAERAMARSWDRHQEQSRKERGKADAAWLKEHQQKADKAENVRTALNQRRVVKGMTPDQVREVLGEPDAQSLQEGRENITVWSYRPDDGPQYTISFRDGEVNSVYRRSGRTKRK